MHLLRRLSPICFALVLLFLPGANVATAYATETAEPTAGATATAETAATTETALQAQQGLTTITRSKDNPADFPLNSEASIDQLSAANVSTLESIMVRAVDAVQSYIDVSYVGATYQDALAALDRLWNNHPDLFYFRTTTITYDYSGRVLSLQPIYYWSTAQIAVMRDQYNDAVYDALLWVGYNMTDLEKAKALHDYLVRNCAYDYANYAHGTIPQESYTAYGALVRGTAVCQGYGEAYMALMQKAGIPCTYVSSTAMNHGWNIVTINGKNYHVDVTWDDPVSFSTGADGGFWDKVNTDYFMISDQAMRSRKHYGWSPTPTCNDQRYDNVRNWETYSEPVEPLYRFRDVGANDWYVTSGVLEYVFDAGILTGLNEVTFAPSGTLTRAQFATMLWRYLAPHEANSYNMTAAVNTTGMSDVASHAWYTGAANWAVRTGAIAGVGGGTSFAPNSPISREQVVVILLRLAKHHSGYGQSTWELYRSFADSSTTSSWAQASILEALQIGLIQGSGNKLSPTRSCTRIEGATFVMRAIEEAHLF